MRREGRSRSGNVDMRGARAFNGHRKPIVRRGLAWLAAAAGLMFASVYVSGEPAPRPPVKQLSNPSYAKHHFQPKRRAIARRRKSASPWPRAKVRHMVTLAQLASVGRIKRSRHTSLRAHRRPAFSHVVEVDQLLRVPPRDADRDDDWAAARALGIPVISGVPPIVIITPPQREKHPPETAARHRTR
jgi:hypothetical protein